jgi:hypothetical protein
VEENSYNTYRKGPKKVAKIRRAEQSLGRDAERRHSRHEAQLQHLPYVLWKLGSSVSRRLRFYSQQMIEIFPIFIASRSALGLTQFPVQWVPGSGV